MLDHQFRRKKTLPDGILIGLLGAGCSRREKKCRANTEKSRFHVIPPRLSSGVSSRGHADTTRRVSASSAKSPAPDSPAGHRWALATPSASARRPVRPPERFWLFSGTTPLPLRAPRESPLSLQPASIPATAARASSRWRPPPRLALAPGNPPTAPLLERPAAAARPIAPCVLEARSALVNNSRRIAGALRDPSLLLPPGQPPATGLSISHMLSSLHHFQQKFSRRVHPRPYGPRRNPEHRAHIRGVHLFNQRKLQDAAQFLWQALYFPAEAVQHHVLLGIPGTVHGRSRLANLPGRIARQAPPAASLAVQSQVKNDAVHPRAEFFRFPQRCELLEGAQKRFLCDILRVGGIAQDAEGNLKNAPLILSDALGKSRLGTLRFDSGNQRTHARACHACSAPYLIDTAAGRLVQQNSMPGGGPEHSSRSQRVSGEGTGDARRIPCEGR